MAEEDITKEDKSSVNSEIDQATSKSVASDVTAATEAGDIVEFAWGEALTPSAAKSIAQLRPTRLVILAGGVGSGKTTLVSTIYEKFQFGQVAQYIFAGSKTLLEFERICHDARIASNRSIPATERTKRTEDYRLLHLSVRNQNTNRKQEILFTDITGEIFEEIRDSSDECRGHPIFSRCDHFAILLDGEKLSNALTRAKAVNDAVMILRRLLDSGILGGHSLVDVLVTKLDIINAAVKKDKGLTNYIDEMKINKFETPFSSRIAKLTIGDIAARPDAIYDSSLKWGHGIDELLGRWIEYYPNTRLMHSKGDILSFGPRAIDSLARYQ